MSLELAVIMKDRLTKERLSSLHAFLTKEGFVKEKLGSSFFYLSTKPNISVDVYLTKALRKGDDLWDYLQENRKSIPFPPKSAITMESRHTKASHLKAYALGKAIAARFGGIVFDPQMTTAYDAKGKPIGEPGMEKELCYGKPIGPFMDAVARLEKLLNGGTVAKTPKRKKAKKAVPTAKRNAKASK